MVLDIMPGVRDKYAKMGVKGFYETQSESYENPHERIIQKLVREADVQAKMQSH